MHTIKVVAGGMILLALCLLVGRMYGATPAVGLALGVKAFVPLWFVASAANMWAGVSRAGYTIAQEAPVFGVVFVAPVSIALAIMWIALRMTR